MEEAKEKIEEIHVKLGNDSVLVSTWGATVLSWICDGRERLFLSPLSKKDGLSAIRGGIPIVFPQFGPGKMKQHGFARISNWSILEQKETSVLLKLAPNVKSRSMWGDVRFELHYLVKLSKNKLITSMSIRNNSEKAFEYDILFHNYYRTSRPQNLTLQGFSGYKYFDKVGSKTHIDEEKSAVISRETDRIYDSTDRELVLSDSGTKSTIRIRKSPSLKSTVLWNPWVAKSKRMVDFPDEGYRSMICIEPLALKEKLEAGKFKEYSVECEYSSRL